MSGPSKIEWCDATWNPVRGCSRVSSGCGGPNHEGGCYAEKIAARFSGPGQAFEGYAEMRGGEARWTGEVSIVASMLDLPLHWKKPRRIFVNSMSDLFHEKLPDEDIDRVFAVMALCPQHQFLVLTKRAERMREYCDAMGSGHRNIGGAARSILRDRGESEPQSHPKMIAVIDAVVTGPLTNVWLGVSVEDQATADERIPHLLETPAAIRFVSYEPALGPVDFEHIAHENSQRRHYYASLSGYVVDGTQAQTDRLDWVIVGGESGPGARPFDIAWARSAVRQCKAAGVACFMKQLGTNPRLDGVQFPEERRMGGWDSKGGDMDLWPKYLRVREWPEAAA